jgi:hypothetical protein
VLLRTADHNSDAVTDAVVAEVPARRMLEVFHGLPRLGAAILWAASRDEAMVVEHLVGVGRRDAPGPHRAPPGRARAAAAAGRPRLRGRLRLPAEPVRAGRRARAHRRAPEPHPAQAARAQLATFRDGEVAIHDPARLRALAGHHGGYLDQGAALEG